MGHAYISAAERTFETRCQQQQLNKSAEQHLETDHEQDPSDTARFDASYPFQTQNGKLWPAKDNKNREKLSRVTCRAFISLILLLAEKKNTKKKISISARRLRPSFL